MTARHHGSCLCGMVRFEIDGDFDRFFLCHCEYCRKDTGSAHAANLFASSAKLEWRSGADSVRTFRLPETRHSKSFCANCGSALPIVAKGGALLIVPAGSLGSDVPLRPDAHIFCASRANWDDALETVPRIERFPG